MDWKALAPHQPLEQGDPLHVPRPMGDGQRLASLVRAGLGPLAVAGPVGSGKSTELAVAAQALEPDYAISIQPFDRILNMRRLQAAHIHWALGNKLMDAMLKQKMAIPTEVRQTLAVPPQNSKRDEGSAHRDACLAVLRELEKQSSIRLALFADGLEKCTEEVARPAVRALLSLKDEMELVLVVPPSLVTGPENVELLNELRVFPVRPVPVLEEVGSRWKEGRQFLADIFKRRMGEDPRTEALAPLVETASIASGGLPRNFLQLMRDAGGYAAVANRELPTREDLDSAMRDQADSLRRLLRDGDMRVMQEADGTDGLEVPIERRIRLLTHGLLLEYEVGDKVLVRMHPLLRA
jgi:hypothetical protein